MDRDSAIKRLRAIDADACHTTLDAFQPGDRPGILDGLLAANQQRLRANEALIDQILTPPNPPATTTGPIPPDGYRLLWVDDFDNLDTDRWSIYGPGHNEKWGQQPAQCRQGFYTPDAVDVSGSVLTITSQPDPQHRTSACGLPGWQTGFLASRTPLPAYGHYAVRYRIDAGSWGWDAPLWLTHSQRGADEAEVDVCERFPERGDKARQAVHLRRDGGSTTYNVGPKLLRRNHEAPYGDPDGWHVDEALIERDGAHARITLTHDGTVTYSFSTAEIPDHSAWLDSLTGWNARICTQIGGQGGAPSGTGPYRMHIDWVAISAPEQETPT